MRTLRSTHVGRTGKLWHLSLMTQNFMESCESYEVGICCLNQDIFDAAGSLHGVQLSLQKVPASSRSSFIFTVISTQMSYILYVIWWTSYAYLLASEQVSLQLLPPIINQLD